MLPAVEEQPSTEAERGVAQAAVYGSRPTPAERVEVDLGGGDHVEVTKGPETFFPIKFNGFTVGPVSVRVSVREGESGDDALVRAAAAAEVGFAASFDVALRQYFERLDRTHVAVQARKR